MAGKVVKTKSGLQGRTKNGDQPVNGKIKVYLDNGTQTLCDPKTLTPIGFWD
jgi:hypothetical protein